MAFVLSSLFAAVSLLATSSPAAASETRTDLEKIYEDVQNSRRTSALTRIDAYLKMHPDNADVLSMRGRYLISENKDAEAEKVFRRALQINPKHSRAWGGLSFALLDKKDLKGAFEAAIKSDNLWVVDPLFPLPEEGVLKNLAILSKQANRTADIAKYNRKVKHYELANLARTYREQGALDKSLELLDKLLKDDPNSTYGHLLRGVVYNNQSEHAKAIKDLDAVIAAQPTMTTALYIRGDSYSEMGNKAKALESYKQLLKAHPNSFPDLAAFCYVAMTGRFREHFEPNDEVIVNRADIYYLCGVAESDLKQFDQAVKDYSECINLDKGEYRAHFNRAVVYEHLNKDALVMADLNQAIKLNGKYVEALLERAKMYEKTHDNEKALSDYSRVIAVNPKEFGPYILRADLAVRIKNYEQAISDYTHAAKLSPSEDDPLVGRAKVYTILGRYDDALADYRKAMQLNPQDKAVVLDAIARVEKLKKKS